MLAVVVLIPLRCAGADAGDVIQVNNIGVPVYVHNFDARTDTSIADRLSIAEVLGAHYFITSRLRVGMMVQLTEEFTGTLPSHGDRWTTFALLPQVGYTFLDRFFVAGVFTYAPRSGERMNWTSAFRLSSVEVSRSTATTRSAMRLRSRTTFTWLAQSG
jgi:hypothetical protein